MAPILIYTIEGHRIGNSGTALALPVLVLGAMPFMGIERVAPIHAILSALFARELPTGRFVRPGGSPRPDSGAHLGLPLAHHCAAVGYSSSVRLGDLGNYFAVCADICLGVYTCLLGGPEAPEAASDGPRHCIST